MFPGSSGSIWANHIVSACAVYVICVTSLSSPFAFNFHFSAMAMTCLRSYLANRLECCSLQVTLEETWISINFKDCTIHPHSYQYPCTLINMHISIAINIYEQVHNQWNNRIDEVISEYGNESLPEQEPAWNILNAVQHNVRKKNPQNITTKNTASNKNVYTNQNLL